MFLLTFSRYCFSRAWGLIRRSESGRDRVGPGRWPPMARCDLESRSLAATPRAVKAMPSFRVCPPEVLKSPAVEAASSSRALVECWQSTVLDLVGESVNSEWLSVNQCQENRSRIGTRELQSSRVRTSPCVWVSTKRLRRRAATFYGDNSVKP